MQGHDDFAEIPIKTEAPTPPPPSPGIGHNMPPEQTLAPRDALAGLIRIMMNLQPEHYELMPVVLKEILDSANDDLMKRLGQFEESLSRTPEKIADQETAGKVADFVAVVIAAEKRLEDRFSPSKEPFLRGGRLVDGYFNDFRRAFGGIKQTLLQRVQAYQDDLREAERKRLAAIAEAQRLEAERKRKEAEEAAQKGKMDEAIAQATEAQVSEQRAEKAEQQAVAPPPAATQIRGSFGGVISSQRRWAFEVKDLKALPVELLLANETLIRAKMNAWVKQKSLKDGEENTALLPGVRFYQTTGTQGRS